MIESRNMPQDTHEGAFFQYSPEQLAELVAIQLILEQRDASSYKAMRS